MRTYKQIVDYLDGPMYLARKERQVTYLLKEIRCRDKRIEELVDKVEELHYQLIEEV